jgi:hypothetical protein
MVISSPSSKTDVRKASSGSHSPSSTSSFFDEIKATLVLEDGTRFEGVAFGATESVAGEVGKDFKP